MSVDLQRDPQQLRKQATTHVAHWSNGTPIRTALYHLTRGRGRVGEPTPVEY